MDKTYRAALSKNIRFETIMFVILLLLTILSIYKGIITTSKHLGFQYWMDRMVGFAATFISLSTTLKAPTKYTISSNGVHIKWRIKDLIIPFEDISKTEVIDGRFVFEGNIRINGKSGLVKAGPSKEESSHHLLHMPVMTKE